MHEAHGNGVALKRYLTTGQVAKLCCVAPRTASKWIDSGCLPGLRLPGCQDRRVHCDDLVRFMRAQGYHREVSRVYGMAEKLQALYVGVTPALIRCVHEGRGENLPYLCTDNPVDAGAIVHAHRPEAVVIDFALGRTSVKDLATWLRAQDPPPRLLGLTPEDVPFAVVSSWFPEGVFEQLLQKPVDPQRVAEFVEHAPQSRNGR